MKSICVLDGDSQKNADEANGVIKLPGSVPESEVFNFVASNIDNLSMKLAVALHLKPEAEARVTAAVTGSEPDKPGPPSFIQPSRSKSRSHTGGHRFIRVHRAMACEQQERLPKFQEFIEGKAIKRSPNTSRDRWRPLRH